MEALLFQGGSNSGVIVGYIQAQDEYQDVRLLVSQQHGHLAGG
jgi:hypothetical protein